MLKQGVFLRKTAAVKSVLNETCLNKISYLVARMNVNDSGIKKCLIGESYHFCRLKCCLRGCGGEVRGLMVLQKLVSACCNQIAKKAEIKLSSRKICHTT